MATASGLLSAAAPLPSPNMMSVAEPFTAASQTPVAPQPPAARLSSETEPPLHAASLPPMASQLPMASTATLPAATLANSIASQPESSLSPAATPMSAATSQPAVSSQSAIDHLQTAAEPPSVANKSIIISAPLPELTALADSKPVAVPLQQSKVGPLASAAPNFIPAPHATPASSLPSPPATVAPPVLNPDTKRLVKPAPERKLVAVAQLGEGHSSALISSPARSRPLKLVGTVTGAYTYAFAGCGGLLVRSIDLHAGGRFPASGLPAYKFCVVDFRGAVVSTREHAPALRSLRLSLVIGDHIFVSGEGSNAAVFSPRVREESSVSAVYARINDGGRALNAIDQGDEVAAVFENATGLVGARLMHVVNDNAEGPADEHLRIVAAPCNLVGDNTSDELRWLIGEYRPHGVVAVDDAEQLIPLHPGDHLKVRDATIRVISCERVAMTPAGPTEPQGLFMRTTVLGGNADVLSVGDTVTW